LCAGIGRHWSVAVHNGKKNFFLAVPFGLVVEDAVVYCLSSRPQPIVYSYWRMRAAPRLLKVASAPSKVGSVEIIRFLS
jgi:hypothetical protein